MWDKIKHSPGRSFALSTDVAPLHYRLSTIGPGQARSWKLEVRSWDLWSYITVILSLGRCLPLYHQPSTLAAD